MSDTIPRSEWADVLAGVAADDLLTTDRLFRFVKFAVDLAMAKYHGHMRDFQDDIVQEAFLISWRTIKEQRNTSGPESFGSFILSVTENLCRTYHKRSTRQFQVSKEQISTASYKKPNVEENIVGVESLLSVADLSNQQLKVVKMRYVMGMTASEVGSTLGVTSSTVYAQTELANRKLVSLSNPKVKEDKEQYTCPKHGYSPRPLLEGTKCPTCKSLRLKHRKDTSNKMNRDQRHSNRTPSIGTVVELCLRRVDNGCKAA